MNNQRTLITTAITSLLALGITAAAGSAYAAADEEKCYGVAKAGQNACNSNKSKHSCAGHSKIDNDPSDFITLPTGSCMKIGGKLAPAENKPEPGAKM
jgi:uncharacterized membrane protein